MTQPLNVGMIGYGFMAKAHSNAWRRVPNFFPELEHRPVLKAVAARTDSKVRAFADVWGYESVETDWRRLIARDDIDLVDICVPNRFHKEIALAAADAGNWIACEKPLAMNAAEGEVMVAAVERARVPNMVWYNYRRVPAIALARQLIDEGRIGRPYHYRAQFLQDSSIAPDVPQGGAALWRLDVDAAGSGVTGDLLAHNIDTALWLNGPIVRHGRDRDLREGGDAPRDRQGRAGRHWRFKSNDPVRQAERVSRVCSERSGVSRLGHRRRRGTSARAARNNAGDCRTGAKGDF